MRKTMWYIHEYFRTQREALRYAADEQSIANQAKRVEPVAKSDGLYREGFKWAVEVQKP